MDLQQQAAKLKADMQAIVDRAKAENRDLTDDEATEIEAKATELEAVNERIKRSEKAQRMVDDLAGAPVDEPDSDETVKGRSVSERFIKSDPFRAFRKANPSGVTAGTPVDIQVRGVGSVKDLGVGKKELTTETGQWVGHGREPGYRDELPVDEPLTFLNLITVGTTDVAFSEYARIIAETNNAAIVPEGELKPLSDIETADGESRAYTYADGFVVTNQTLADDGALVTFMESRIRRHVQGVIEDKILNGTGTGEPEGILNTTGTLAQAFDEDVVTTLARALELFDEHNGTASVQAIVMNPRDVWNLRLLKDTNGNPLLGNPLQQGVTPTPFGVPLVSSTRVAQGTALVGRFDSMNYLELEPLNVLAFNQHEDFARRNKVYVRAESRGRQVFYAPREVVVTALTNGGGGVEG